MTSNNGEECQLKEHKTQSTQRESKTCRNCRKSKQTTHLRSSPRRPPTIQHHNRNENKTLRSRKNQTKHTRTTFYVQPLLATILAPNDSGTPLNPVSRFQTQLKLFSNRINQIKRPRILEKHHTEPEPHCFDYDRKSTQKNQKKAPEHTISSQTSRTARKTKYSAILGSGTPQRTPRSLSVKASILVLRSQRQSQAACTGLERLAFASISRPGRRSITTVLRGYDTSITRVRSAGINRDVELCRAKARNSKRTCLVKSALLVNTRFPSVFPRSRQPISRETIILMQILVINSS